MIKNTPKQSPGSGANSNNQPRSPLRFTVRKNGGGRGNGRRPFIPRTPAGSGDLVAAAAAYASGQKSRAPRIQANRDQSHIIHRELVMSVVGSVSFAVMRTLALNPGLIATFPWLATQAIGWEKYRFNSLRFCYYTRTGATTPGSVLLAPDYDAADSPPLSEAAASAYTDVSEDAPWKNITCELTKKHMGAGERYIRSGPLAPNLDIKTYDVGQLFLCCLDGTAVPWGKLWVEYDVVLSSPQLPPSGGVLLDAAVWNTANGTEFDPFESMVPAAPTDLGLVTLQDTGNIIFNKPGRYAVVMSIGAGTKDISIDMADAAFSDARGSVLTYDDTPNGSYNFFTHALVDVFEIGATLAYNPVFATSPDAVLCVVGVYQVPSDQGAFIVNT